MKTHLLIVATTSAMGIAFLVPRTCAGTFTNGSFELPGGLPDNSCVELRSGDTTLTGWTIACQGTNSTLAWHNGMALPELDYIPIDGSYQIVFNGGNRPAGDLIAQTFETIPGVDYEVTFYVGRLGTGDGQVSLTASVTSKTGQELGRLMASPPNHGYGARHQLVFEATTDQTTLFFTDTSLETISVDVALDNVAVTPVAPDAAIRVCQVEVSWSSLSNRIYQVQYRSENTTNAWVNLGEPVMGTGSHMSITDTVSEQNHRLYRIVKLP